jgi:hypothetical protein
LEAAGITVATEKGTIGVTRVVDTTEGMMIAGMTVDTIVVIIINGMIAIVIVETTESLWSQIWQVVDELCGPLYAKHLGRCGSHRVLTPGFCACG